MGILEDLRKSGFLFNRGLGQNFILDEGFLDSVVRDLGLEKSDTVVEVGTGAGTLTRVLARTARQVITFEIDKRLEPILTKQFDGIQNITLIFNDALKLTESEITNLIPADKSAWKLVANLPYYITTPLIMKFLSHPNCTEISVLVQKELGQRIIAKPGTSDYGALSVAVQAAARAKIIRHAPRHLFTPQPKVDSVFVQIKKRPDTENTASDCLGGETFEALLKGIFAARRKTMENALALATGLKKDDAARILDTLGIKATLRPEQITVEEYIRLAHFVSKNV